MTRFSRTIVAVAVLALVCGASAAKKRPLPVSTGNLDDLQGYLEQLVPLGKKKKAWAFMRIRPLDVEEWVLVQRVVDGFQVSVFLCPEDPESMGEEVGRLVNDFGGELLGAAVSEERCNIAQLAGFADAASAADLIRAVFTDVFGTERFTYKIQRLRRS